MYFIIGMLTDDELSRLLSQIWKNDRSEYQVLCELYMLNTKMLKELSMIDLLHSKMLIFIADHK